MLKVFLGYTLKLARENQNFEISTKITLWWSKLYFSKLERTNLPEKKSTCILPVATDDLETSALTKNNAKGLTD